MSRLLSLKCSARLLAQNVGKEQFYKSKWILIAFPVKCRCYITKANPGAEPAMAMFSLFHTKAGFGSWSIWDFSTKYTFPFLSDLEPLSTWAFIYILPFLQGVWFPTLAFIPTFYYSNDPVWQIKPRDKWQAQGHPASFMTEDLKLNVAVWPEHSIHNNTHSWRSAAKWFCPMGCYI